MTAPAPALLLAVALSAPALAAQPPRVPVPVGARVRVAAPPRIGWTTGTVAATDSARLVLRSAPRAAADTFLLASVEALQVSRGRRRLARGVAGLLIGTLVGGAVGAGGGALAEGGRIEEGYGTYWGAIGGAAAGAIVGGTVGALTARERWAPVRLR